jgi:ATP-dependent Clp protease ATP-binding subunit ClpA
MDGIVDIQLRRLEKRLAERKITLELDEARGRGWPTRATTRSSARVR